MLKKAEGVPIEAKNEVKRGQRAKCNVYEDGWVDPEIVKEVCQPFLICSAACQEYDWRGASPYCSAFQEYLGPERLMKPCERFKGEK